MFIKGLIYIFLSVFFIIPPLGASIENEVNAEEKDIENEIQNFSKNKTYFNSNIEKKEYLEIQDLKEILVKNNKEIKILKSKIEQSKANLKGKLTLWYPKFYINSNDVPKYTLGNDYKNQNTDTSTEKLLLGINGNIEWDLINPKRRLEIKIAKQELSNSKDLLDSKISDLYFESIKLFYYIQASYQEIKVAKKSIEISKFALAEAKEKYKSGVGNKLDVLEAKTQLDRDQIKLLKEIGELNKNKNSLFLILNTDEIYDIKEKNKSLISWIWDLNFDDSLSAAYKNRLDLKIKNQDISINKNKSLSILSGKKPNFTIYNQYSLSKSWGENDVTTNPDFKNENKRNLNSVGMKFNWNIFDGGLIRQNYISSKNRTEELQNEFDLSKNQIKKQLVDSFINLDISIQNLMYSFNQLEAAKETLNISLKRLNAGLTTQREVVNIQADVSESESNFINSITNYNVSVAELERLTLIDKKDFCSLISQTGDSVKNKFYKFVTENNLSKNCRLLSKK